MFSRILFFAISFANAHATDCGEMLSLGNEQHSILHEQNGQWKKSFCVIPDHNNSWAIGLRITSDFPKKTTLIDLTLKKNSPSLEVSGMIGSQNISGDHYFPPNPLRFKPFVVTQLQIMLWKTKFQLNIQNESDSSETWVEKFPDFTSRIGSSTIILSILNKKDASGFKIAFDFSGLHFSSDIESETSAYPTTASTDENEFPLFKNNTILMMFITLIFGFVILLLVACVIIWTKRRSQVRVSEHRQSYQNPRIPPNQPFLVHHLPEVNMSVSRPLMTTQNMGNLTSRDITHHPNFHGTPMSQNLKPVRFNPENLIPLATLPRRTSSNAIDRRPLPSNIFSPSQNPLQIPSRSWMDIRTDMEFPTPSPSYSGLKDQWATDSNKQENRLSLTEHIYEAVSDLDSSTQGHSSVNSIYSQMSVNSKDMNT